MKKKTEKVVNKYYFLDQIRKYPILIGIGIFVAGGATSINIRTNGTIGLLLFVGDTILVASILVSLLDDKEELKRKVKKSAIISLFWFCSCIAVMDFNITGSAKDIFNKAIELVTAYIFIFLGCFLPDFITKKQKDDNEQKADELTKNSISGTENESNEKCAENQER